MLGSVLVRITKGCLGDPVTSDCIKWHGDPQMTQASSDFGTSSDGYGDPTTCFTLNNNNNDVVVDFFLTCKNCGRMFDNSFPACFFLFKWRLALAN